MVDVVQAVRETVLDIVKRKSASCTGVERDQQLVADLGLSSMDFAGLVAALEMKLDLDPFAETVSITSIRTVGDLCDAYEKCAALQ